MTEDDVAKIVRDTLRTQFAAIMMASVVENQSQNRVKIQRFATDTPIGNTRNVQPYGVSSKAPKDTPCLLVPINGDPSHINTVGHFDEGRPDINDGEMAIYNEFGQLIYLSDGKIQIGSKAATENLVLGQVFKAYEAAFLDAVIAHRHMDLFGYLTDVPDNDSTFSALKASPIEDEAILSDENFTEKG